MEPDDTMDHTELEPNQRIVKARIPYDLDRLLAMAAARHDRTKASILIEAIGDICRKLEQEKPV